MSAAIAARATDQEEYRLALTLIKAVNAGKRNEAAVLGNKTSIRKMFRARDRGFRYAVKRLDPVYCTYLCRVFMVRKGEHAPNRWLGVMQIEFNGYLGAQVVDFSYARVDDPTH